MTKEPIVVVVDNRLWMPRESLPEAVVATLAERCTYANPERAKLERLARRDLRLAYRLKELPVTISTHAEIRLPPDSPLFAVFPFGTWNALTLPRGAMGKLREVLQANGLAWRVIDKRSKGEPSAMAGWAHRHSPDPSAPNGGALRWYQEEAVEAAIAKQNCLIRAPTGSGKTTTAIALLARLQMTTLVIVWTSGLLEQWRERLMRELSLAKDEIGVIGGGSVSVRAVTLAMQQTLIAKFKHGEFPALCSHFGLVICDEVQRFAANTFLAVVDRFDSQYRVGVSADETRADGKEFLVYDVFGGVAHEVTQSELVESGAVLDVECRVVPTEFRAPWYTAQIQEGAPDFNRLLDELVVDKERNALVASLAASEASVGEQVIVWSQRVEHAQRFDALLSAMGVRTGIMLGGEEWRVRFEEAKAGLLSKRLSVVTGTIQAVGTGIDIPSLSRGILATPIGSNRQLYGQIRGRLSRPNKGDAVLYVLWDRFVQGKSMLKRLLAWNRSVLVRDEDGSWVEGRAYLKREEG